MKRNFLLMLLLTLLPLAGWAQDPDPEPQQDQPNPNVVVIGDYTATLSNWWITPGEDAPNVEVTREGITGTINLTDGGVVNSSKEKVDSYTEGGVYYRMMTFTDGKKKVIYVPFYVTPTIEWTRVNTNDNGEFDLTNVAPEAYWQYYQENPASDIWCTPNSASTDGPTNTEGFILFPGQRPTENGGVADPNYASLSKDQWIAAVVEEYGNQWNFDHTWDAAKWSKPDNIVFSLIRLLSDRRAVRRAPSQDPTFNVIARYGDVNKMPWGTRVFGFSGDVKTYGMLSVAPNPHAPNTQSDIETEFGVTPEGFDEDLFSLLLLPTAFAEEGYIADVQSLADAYLEPEDISYPYNGAEQYPDFDYYNGDASIMLTIPAAEEGEDDEEKVLVENVDFTVSYPDADYIHNGTKNFTITGIGAWDGTKNFTYKIVGKRVIINPAYTYKTYGTADPLKPNFELDSATPLVEGEDAKDVITPFLLLKRVTGEENQSENVGAYLYYIDLAENYATDCDYEISILQNNSNLVIQPAELHINVTNYWKKYQAADPTTFTYDIVSGLVVNPDLNINDTKDNVAITITRAEGEAVNASVQKVSGKDVVVVEGEGYAFEGNSQNYKVIVDNAFGIIPTDDIAGITVTVSNKAGTSETNPYYGVAKYEYRGTAYEPGKVETDEEADLIVKDGANTLTVGTDYTIKEYKDNVHVGEATVTVTMKGSYTAQDVSGKFNIEKAPLTITAKSYTLTPGAPDPEFEVLYAGWKNSEGTETAPGTNPAPKGFKAPSGVTKVAIGGTTASTLKVNEDAEADDYTIKYADGALSFGQTVLIAIADNKTKTFGADDPDLTVTVKKVDGTAEVPASESEIALLTYGGKSYYDIAREEGENVGGGSNTNGTYPITFDGPTKLPEGVVVVYRAGEFQITRKTVFLRGDDATKVYGDANPTFDASVWELGEGTTEPTKWSDEKKTEEGVVNQTFYYVGVQGATWNGNAWVLSSEDATPANGGYTVTATVRTGYNTPNGITTSGNYYVVADPDHSGKFTITKAPLTIAVDENQGKSYNATEPELTATVTGLKRNDALVKGTDYTITREAGENVGPYAITVATVPASVQSGTLKNYDPITLTGGTFTITATDLAIEANDQVINYGGTIDPYDVIVKIDGVDQHWTKEQIEAVLMLTTTASKVGRNKDAFNLVPANNANYNVSEERFKNAWLVISPLKEIPLGQKALDLITDKPLAQVLEDHKGLQLKVILPKRAMEADQWYEWVLPFETAPRDFFSTAYKQTENGWETRWGYGAIDVLDVNKTKNGQVVFDITVNKIPANTPFLVKIDTDIASADMAEIEFPGVTIADKDADGKEVFYFKDGQPVKPEVASNDGSVKFVGLYEDKTGVDGNQMFLAQVGDKPKREFYRGDDDREDMQAIKLIRTKAYLEFVSAEAAAGVKIFIQEPDGTYTAINGVEAENVANAEGIYNLSGQRVNKAQKGIYIMDGKKVLVK